ncbi:MAG TPA: methylated-DNA--[protein]-cysteine S-methyltransferase [Rectinemataceae bacterium]|nr:methylated-DNA--[protein]-cysteine S-methyltransferase [Rectinemataceae bacterium]
MDENSSDYARVEAAIRFIEKNAVGQPSLDEVACHIGLSPFHFQRLFTRWAGVSPKRFLQYLTVESAKKLLDESATILDATFEVGLSSPSRLHDLFVNAEAVTPGEFKSAGEGMEIRWAIQASLFGDCLVATSPRGVCALEFLDAASSGLGSAETDRREADPRLVALAALQRRWRGAVLIEDPATGRRALDHLFSAAGHRDADVLRLHLKGSNFQLKVWRALLAIPEGRLVSYGKLAEMIGSPGSARAVGTALGQNPIGLIIPCHRVLRSSGEIGGYKWGIERKKALIAYEASTRL